MALLTALGMGLLSACASGADAQSIAGTMWNGTDSDGYRYEFHFDRGGGLVAYDPDSDRWTYSDDEAVLSWSQKGNRVTVTNSSIAQDFEFVASGTIDGDTLILIDDSEPPIPLELTRVAAIDSVVAGSEWAGTLLAPDDSLEDRGVSYFFDPDGSFRQLVSLPDREVWVLLREDYTYTWTVSGDVVLMVITDVDNDFEYSHIGTIDEDQMTIETNTDPSNTIARLARVE